MEGVCARAGQTGRWPRRGGVSGGTLFPPNSPPLGHARWTTGDGGRAGGVLRWSAGDKCVPPLGRNAGGVGGLWLMSRARREAARLVPLLLERLQEAGQFARDGDHRRDEGRRDDLAVDLQLQESPRDAKPAWAGVDGSRRCRPLGRGSALGLSLSVRLLQTRSSRRSGPSPWSLRRSFSSACRSCEIVPWERTSRAPSFSARATEIVSLWTSNPTKRIGLVMRLSVGVFTLENRCRSAGGFLTGGSARVSVRATRDFLTAGKRTPFFPVDGRGFAEGTQPSCLGPDR